MEAGSQLGRQPGRQPGRQAGRQAASQPARQAGRDRRHIDEMHNRITKLTRYDNKCRYNYTLSLLRADGEFEVKFFASSRSL